MCVKVPYHRDIVVAALEAGKHVLCEWPLALSVKESQGLQALAEHSGLHAAIGLQGRMGPAVQRARALIADGSIGQPLTANIVSTTEGHGAQLPTAYAYLCDPLNGATMSTILTGHTLDLAVYLLGAMREVQALTTTKYESVKLTDATGHVARPTPDYLAIQARFENGCMLSAEIDGGRPGDTPFSFQILGTRGSLTLRGGHPYGFQAGEVHLEATVPFDQPEGATVPQVAGVLVNVGALYAQLARDIRRGEWVTPAFHHATRLHQLIDSIGVAAASGRRQMEGDWPVS